MAQRHGGIDERKMRETDGGREGSDGGEMKRTELGCYDKRRRDEK